MEDFDKIYAEYYSEVYKFVLTLCQNHTLAEEITQESFFKALKSIDSFNGNCKLSTWLCRIARNTFYSYTKKHNRQVDYPLDIILSDVNIEEQFADKETAYTIHKVLHKLNEPYKEVFWLRIFGELSFAQIGALFEKTESWARVTYYRAKIMIKEELQGLTLAELLEIYCRYTLMMCAMKKANRRYIIICRSVKNAEVAMNL